MAKDLYELEVDSFPASPSSKEEVGLCEYAERNFLVYLCWWFWNQFPPHIGQIPVEPEEQSLFVLTKRNLNEVSVPWRRSFLSFGDQSQLVLSPHPILQDSLMYRSPNASCYSYRPFGRRSDFEETLKVVGFKPGNARPESGFSLIEQTAEELSLAPQNWYELCWSLIDQMKKKYAIS